MLAYNCLCLHTAVDCPQAFIYFWYHKTCPKHPYFFGLWCTAHASFTKEKGGKCIHYVGEYNFAFALIHGDFTILKCESYLWTVIMASIINRIYIFEFKWKWNNRISYKRRGGRRGPLLQIYVKSIICLISKFKEEFKSWNENLPKFWQLGEILHISFLYFIFDFLDFQIYNLCRRKQKTCFFVDF